MMRTGIYTYRMIDFRGGYITRTTPVEILGETQRSYKIRLIGYGAYGAAPGRVMYVRKRSVRTKDTPTPVIPEDAAYRLPYKD